MTIAVGGTCEREEGKERNSWIKYSLNESFWVMNVKYFFLFLKKELFKYISFLCLVFVGTTLNTFADIICRKRKRKKLMD